MKIHDAGYKKLFSNLQIFIEFLKTFIKLPWIKDLDLTKAEMIDKSFISSKYQASESDLIYKLQVANQPVYVYILMEFKSVPDRYLPLRLMNYVCQLYMTILQSRKSGDPALLPFILPICLYTGNQTWNYSLDFNEMIEDTAFKKGFEIQFPNKFINVQDYDPQELRNIKNIISLLFYLESNSDWGSVKADLLELYNSESDKQAISMLFNWMEQKAKHGYIKKEKFQDLETIILTPEEAMQKITWLTAEEREEIYSKGISDGESKGKAEGIAEGKAEDILKCLRKRFQRELPKSVAQAILSQMEISILDQWLDLALDVKDLKTFLAETGIQA